MSISSLPDTDQHRRTFASDNYSGAHPEVMAALAEANVGHAPAYGDDPWTAQLKELVGRLFAPEAEVHPVFNGTGANVIGLQAALPRWGAVICAGSAHIQNDEGAAPEKTGGLKLLALEAPDGKLTPELVEGRAWGWGDPHRAQPLAVSITQSTELGTCYTPDEVRALAECTHRYGMVLHMDGSRLGNAAAHLGASLAEITADAGVDVLSLGGTKNGLMGAEAVVVLRPHAALGMEYLRKTNMQLGSKMRFLSAQLLALYEGDLWHRSAAHANAMAARLRRGLEEIPEVGLDLPTQANVVFAVLPPEAKSRAREAFHFYDWPGRPGLVRLMCSFDTTPEDVDALVDAVSGAAR
ncbi:low specificity L-threonine aldolase [Nesterenkonia sp. NBAIMH1]|uniref:threonine aldolase family protein n=1 Tax=Nesterenkonia sp. NBAIMH1 TaxID=2600320 RepID=UPI001FEEF406|nr:beta-eliminating lyase-related protein [Nesterenkonia sp. NBAIMH1]